MKNIIAILGIMLSFPIQADWSKADTNRQLVFTGVAILDWSQTRYISKHPDEFYEDFNKYLGKHPTTNKVNNYFMSAIIINYGIAYALPDRYRKYWQRSSIIVETYFVARNYRLGIGFDF
jgi:hypothetical protein